MSFGVQVDFGINGIIVFFFWCLKKYVSLALRMILAAAVTNVSRLGFLGAGIYFKPLLRTCVCFRFRVVVDKFMILFLILVEGIFLVMAPPFAGCAFSSLKVSQRTLIRLYQVLEYEWGQLDQMLKKVLF